MVPFFPIATKSDYSSLLCHMTSKRNIKIVLRPLSHPSSPDELGHIHLLATTSTVGRK